MYTKLLLGMALSIPLTATTISSNIDLSPNRDSLWKAANGNLPAHWLTKEDSLARESYLQNYRVAQTRVVPTNPRSIAEFEPVEAVVIAYAGSFGFQVNLIEELSKTTKVFIAAPSSSVTTVNSILSNSKAIRDSITIISTKGVDSYWTRDYGPWCIAEGDQKISIVDFQYNRPRPHDDSLPVVIAKKLGMSSYFMDLQQCGGNYMSNGLGEAVSTELVKEENTSKPEAQIRSIMKSFLGITNYHITIDPLGDYIKHVDCWGKFLGPDKILIGDVTTDRKDAYDSVAAYFAKAKSPYGTPYKVFRYKTEGEPYSNSTIVNNRVFVPIQGTANDAAALAVYKKAMPGYEIVGITNTGPNPWMGTDALHCRTMGIAKRNLLYISHLPKVDTVKTQGKPIQISCKIVAYSKKGIIPDSTRLFYKKGTASTFTEVPMVKKDSLWYADIPFESITRGQKAIPVQYYIAAGDSSKENARYPLMGEKDPFTFVAYSDATPLAEPTMSEMPFSFEALPTSLTISTPNAGKLQVFSVNGQLLLTTQIHSAGTVSIPHSLNKSSVLIYRFESGNETKTKKFLIRK